MITQAPYGMDDWDLDGEGGRIIRRLAKRFAVPVKRFLTDLTWNRLPGQRPFNDDPALKRIRAAKTHTAALDLFMWWLIERHVGSAAILDPSSGKPLAVTADLIQFRRPHVGFEETRIAEKIRYCGVSVAVEQIGILKIDPSRIGWAAGDIETVLVGEDRYFYLRSVRRWKMTLAGRLRVNESMRKWRAWRALSGNRSVFSAGEFKRLCESNSWTPVFRFQRLTEPQILVHFVQRIVTDSDSKRAIVEMIWRRMEERRR